MEKVLAPKTHILILYDRLSFKLMEKWSKESMWPFPSIKSDNHAVQWFKKQVNIETGIVINTIEHVALTINQSYQPQVEITLNQDEAMLLKLTYSEIFI